MGILMCCELSYTWLVELVKLVRVDMGICGGGFEGGMISGICLWRDRLWICIWG